jgi:hypothetical protein
MYRYIAVDVSLTMNKSEFWRRLKYVLNPDNNNPEPPFSDPPIDQQTA